MKINEVGVFFAIVVSVLSFVVAFFLLWVKAKLRQTTGLHR